MNLKNLNDQTLVKNTENLVSEEREILSKVLHHLLEINRRRLYCDLGYKSLFEFAVKHFKYSEDQACRRIAAMKLLNEIPEIEEKINAGNITLTHLSLAQTFFNQESKIENYFSKDEKLELMNQISNKTTREAEQLTKSFASVKAPPAPDKIKVLGDNKIEVRFQASKELLEKIETLKGQLAHKKPKITLGELFEHLCDIEIKNQISPAAPLKRRVNKPNSKIQIRKRLFANANKQCENCGSQYALEIDHRTPKALGSNNNEENLRVLCRNCNQRAAIKIFGVCKMAPYLERDFQTAESKT